MRPTLLLLVVAGCFPGGAPGEVNVTLDSFSDLHITATEQSLEIVVGHTDDVTQSTPCPLEDANLTARLGDIPVPLITRGGKIGEDPGDDVTDALCGTVTLRLDGPAPDGPAVLQLSDSKTTVTCNVPDLKAPRTVTQVPDSDTWQWRSGQAVTLQWSPSGDLPRWTMLLSELFPVDGNARTGDGTELHEAIDGDLVRFTVPSVAPGSYGITLETWGYVPCGPHFVSANISSTFTTFSTFHTVTIVP